MEHRLNAIIGVDKKHYDDLLKELTAANARIAELEAKFEIMCKNFSDEKEFREKIESQYQDLKAKYQKAVECLMFAGSYEKIHKTLAELGEKE